MSRQPGAGDAVRDVREGRSVSAVDILTRGRLLADDFCEDEKDAALLVRMLCDELAAHRLARDTNAPGVAERLMRSGQRYLYG